MTARVNPWWIATALLTGLVVALSAFTFTRSAFAGTGSAPQSAPSSPPGEAPPPGLGSPPVEFSPPQRFYTRTVEIEKARYFNGGNNVAVTLTYDCVPRQTPGQPTTPPPAVFAINISVEASQAEGRDNNFGDGGYSETLTCTSTKQWVTLTVNRYRNPALRTFHSGPALIRATAKYADEEAFLLQFPSDAEAVDLEKR